MSQADNPGAEKKVPVVRQLRTEKPRGPLGRDEPNPNVASDEWADEKGPEEPLEPGVGGYDDRDPASEMPHVPSVEETQDDR